MSELPPVVLIRKIHRSMDMISQYIETLVFERFARNEILVDAVLWNILVIGESCSQITPEVKEKYDDVDWDKFERLKDDITNNIQEIDLTDVWRFITEDLAVVLPRLEDILNDVHSA